MIQEQHAVFSGEAVIAAGGRLADKLGKALAIGMVRGLVGIFGDNGSGSRPDGDMAGLARELIRQDILVLVADAAGAGGLAPADVELAGSGLAEFCDHCGIPPVLSMDGSLDGAPVRALFAALASVLGVEIADLPAAATLGEGERACDGLEHVYGATFAAGPDPVRVAAAISERITAKRLAMGLNDRFDGSVYS